MHANTGTTTTGLIDVLEMKYNGNQLMKVEEGSVIPSLSTSTDFRNDTKIRNIKRAVEKKPKE